MKNIKSIISRLTNCFSDVEAPLGNEVAIIDDWDYSAIQKSFSKYLDEIVTLPESIIVRFTGALAALTPAGLMFFLPSYLIYSIKYPESDVAEYVISFVCSPTIESKYWRDRIDLFDESKRQAVYEFLLEMEKVEEDKTYLPLIRTGKLFWGSDPLKGSDLN